MTSTRSSAPAEFLRSCAKDAATAPRSCDRRTKPRRASMAKPVKTCSRWSESAWQTSRHSTCGAGRRARSIALTPLGVQDAQLEGLADRLRAVHHVQLAQDFLYVVLDGERADLEDRADLEVALAEVDPLQDVLLAHREHALPDGLVAAVRAFGSPLQLRTHPCHVQRRREQLHEVGVARAQAAGPAGEREQAERAA